MVRNIFCKSANVLNSIRKPVPIPLSKQIQHIIFTFVAGIALGIISKVLDENTSILLPSFLEMLELGRFFSRVGVWIFLGLCISVYSKTPLQAAYTVFSFFAGMVGSYYMYTLIISGYYPPIPYMLIWIGITALSPFMGAICWYSKGTHIISICISSCILMIMTRQAFTFGFWYFDIRNGLEILLWILTILILYNTKNQIMMVIGIGLLLFFITSPLNLFWGIL